MGGKPCCYPTKKQRIVKQTKNVMFIYIFWVIMRINCKFELDMSIQAGDENSEASEVPTSEVPGSGGRYR